MNRTFLLVFFIALVSAATGPVDAAVTAGHPVTLATVGPDTLTTDDVRLELALMRARNFDGATVTNPAPADILKRMTQDRLLVQEGYRMGLAEDFNVANQMAEMIRHECMKALLDSVAASVPVEAKDVHEKRRLAVAAYLEGLFRKYHVVVDSTVLKSLDYGSADAAVQQKLRDSDEVVARLPGGRRMTVADLSRELRFVEFHGMVGKADAAERRNRALREHLSQLVMNFQLKAQGMDRAPHMLLMKERAERAAVLEEALRILLTSDFAPSEAGVAKYYKAHLADFTPVSRLKVSSAKVVLKKDADDLRAKTAKGATVRWLAKNDPRAIAGSTPFPADWLDPEQIGLKAADLKMGYVPEPYEVPGGWVVAQIVDIEKGKPAPLESCREQIISIMTRDATRDRLIEILGRLEAVSPVTILPGAAQEVARILNETTKDAVPADGKLSH